MLKEKTQWNLDKEKATPFDTLKQFDRIVGEQCRENKTWRTIAIVSMGAFFLSLITMIWSIAKDAKEKKYVPILISLNDVGESTYHGAANKLNYSNLKIPEEAIEFQIKDFIEKANTIPKDSKVLRDNLKKCYAILTLASSNKFTSEIRKDNPLDLFGTVLRSVTIESIVKVSAKSYQVDYFVLETGMDNLVNEKRTKYRTVVTIEIQQPAEEDKEKNPLGIYIVDFGTTLLKVE